MTDIRLNSAVTRGEIDNSHKGTVHLKLWFIDVEEPLELSLEGDCLRDLAGSHIQFTHNPLEIPEPLSLPQDWLNLGKAEVGEITASSRLCMHCPNKAGGYDKPKLVNVLRLEFFCNWGRLLLESFDFSCFIINHTWEMAEEEEFAQRASNFSAWQNHLSHLLKQEGAKDAQYLAKLYDEIHQRFGDNYNFDQNEAALMGWDGIISALADEKDAPIVDYLGEVLELPLDTALDDGDLSELHDFLINDMGIEEEEWTEGAAIDRHPLIETVQELIEDFEVQAAHLTFPRGRWYQRLINTLDDIEEGLKGLLNPTIINEMPANTSLIGCREYLGKMMLAFHYFSKLLEITETEEGRRELLFLRDGLLDLREGISALRFQANNL